jgi:hypothetical protein
MNGPDCAGRAARDAAVVAVVIAVVVLAGAGCGASHRGAVTSGAGNASRRAPVAGLVPPFGRADEAALFSSLMGGADDGRPEGVPTAFSWSDKAEVDSPTNAGMSAMTAWGLVYAELGAKEPRRGTVRVEVRDIRSYVWSRSAQHWTLVQDTTGVEGAFYREDFGGNDSVPADMRTEPDGGTSVSMAPARNFHFWPLTGRAPVAADDVGAVITTFDARLIGPNASHARYLASAGGDWWRTTTAPFVLASDGANNDGIGTGRFVALSRAWTTIGFYTGGP